MSDSRLIAVASDDNNGLDGLVSGHFGRCPFYTFITIAGSEIVDTRVIENPFYASHQAGAVPEFINNEKANVMISGGMGPKAITFFKEFGIDVVTGASGRIMDALTAYLKGNLAGDSPCKDDSHDCNH